MPLPGLRLQSKPADGAWIHALSESAVHDTPVASFRYVYHLQPAGEAEAREDHIELHRPRSKVYQRQRPPTTLQWFPPNGGAGSGRNGLGARAQSGTR